MSRNDMDAAVAAFIAGGGKVTRLRYGGKKAVQRGSQMAYHRDKALNGSERSKAILEKARQKESQMIFSRDERESEE